MFKKGNKYGCRNKGVPKTKEHVKNQIEARRKNKTLNPSQETKKKISESVKKNNPFRGKHFTKEHKDKIRKALKGKRKKPFIVTGGYILIFKPQHPYCNGGGYVKEQRLIMEKKLGRYLTKKEIVHHLDGNRKNNNIDNLYLFPDISKHIKYHIFLRNCVKEALKMK